ncbi:MAG: hypothetical protein ACOC1P_03085 [Minisyncoccales bacterium]
MVNGLVKEEKGFAKFKRLDEIFGKENLEGREIFVEDCWYMLGLGEIIEENFQENYVKTKYGYIPLSVSCGYHYVK